MSMLIKTVKLDKDKFSKFLVSLEEESYCDIDDLNLTFEEECGFNPDFQDTDEYGGPFYKQTSTLTVDGKELGWVDVHFLIDRRSWLYITKVCFELY